MENDDTLQILPSIQFHKYLSSFLVDNFTYNVDLHINNYSRIKGSTQRQAELRIPLEFTSSIFDDYVSFSLGEEFYYNKQLFGNGDYLNDSYQYYSNYHKAKLFTDLTKKYKSFTHVIQPSLEYVRPGYESEKPLDRDTLISNQPVTEPTLKGLPFPITIPDEGYLFGLSQYIYDDKMKLKFFQRFSQYYFTDKEYKFSDIVNEMGYNWDKVQLYSNITYSTEYSYIKDSSSRISLSGSGYSVSLGHTFKQIWDGKSEDNPVYNITSNDVNFNFRYTYNQHIGFNGAITYNIDDELSEQWSFGGSYKEDCWSMDASMRRSIIPRPTGETIDDTFYIQFNFIPFITVGSN